MLRDGPANTRVFALYDNFLLDDVVVFTLCHNFLQAYNWYDVSDYALWNNFHLFVVFFLHYVTTSAWILYFALWYYFPRKLTILTLCSVRNTTNAISIRMPGIFALLNYFRKIITFVYFCTMRLLPVQVPGIAGVFQCTYLVWYIVGVFQLHAWVLSISGPIPWTFHEVQSGQFDELGTDRSNLHKLHYINRTYDRINLPFAWRFLKAPK